VEKLQARFLYRAYGMVPIYEPLYDAKFIHTGWALAIGAAQSNAGKLEVYFYFRTNPLPQLRRNLLEKHVQLCV
jgi:hypothetical protein